MPNDASPHSIRSFELQHLWWFFANIHWLESPSPFGKCTVDSVHSLYILHEVLYSGAKAKYMYNWYTSKIYIIKIWVCVDCRLWKGSNRKLRSPQPSTYSQTHSHRTRPPRSRNREKWARHDDLPRHSVWLWMWLQWHLQTISAAKFEWQHTLCSSVRLRIHITWINFEVVIWDSLSARVCCILPPTTGKWQAECPRPSFPSLAAFGVDAFPLSQDGGGHPQTHLVTLLSSFSPLVLWRIALEISICEIAWKNSCDLFATTNEHLTTCFGRNNLMIDRQPSAFKKSKMKLFSYALSYGSAGCRDWWLPIRFTEKNPGPRTILCPSSVGTAFQEAQKAEHFYTPQASKSYLFSCIS